MARVPLGTRDSQDYLGRFRAPFQVALLSADAAVLDGQVRPRPSVLLRAAMSGARLVTDPAGNAKLVKGGEGRKARARDDAVAAAILAVAEGRRNAPRQ